MIMLDSNSMIHSRHELIVFKYFLACMEILRTGVFQYHYEREKIGKFPGIVFVVILWGEQM